MLIQNFIDKIKNHKVNFNPKIILDIGSRDLEQSIEFYTIYPESKIYAFEPNQSQYNICKNLAQNYSDRIEVFDLALSDKNGTSDFYITHGNIGASSLLKPWDIPFASNTPVSKTQVNTITLDSWMLDRGIDKIDVIWMDVQGAELSVLKGLSTLKSVSYIHCEASQVPYYENHTVKNELETYLKDNGFELEFNLAVGHPYGEGDYVAINKNIL